MSRYARQLALPQVGPEGQRRLGRARMLVVGAGGLGSPALLYLAAAGVGHITVIDDDRVDVTNLHRQVIHDTAGVGQKKVDSAAARLRALNPEIEIATIDARVDARMARDLVGAFDLVLDGTDNFGTRYALSDACAERRIPYVYGSVQGFEGQAAVLCTGDAPCYRCLFREAPPPGTVPSCGELGVLGVVPGLVGTIQATEAVKLVLGIGQPLVGRLLMIDAARARLHEVELARDPACPACGTTAPAEEGKRRMGSDRDVEEERPVTPVELKAQLDSGDRPVLLDVREPQEWEIAHLTGATHMPMGSIPDRVAELDPESEIVVYCHHGVRSAAVVDWLRAAGFRRVHNLAGGIDRWSLDVDPTLPRY